MKPSYVFKLHEWAADNFSFVQYPNIRQVHVRTRTLPTKRSARAKKVAGVGARFVLGLFMLFVVAPAIVLMAFVFFAMFR